MTICWRSSIQQRQNFKGSRELYRIIYSFIIYSSFHKNNNFAFCALFTESAKQKKSLIFIHCALNSLHYFCHVRFLCFQLESLHLLVPLVVCLVLTHAFFSTFFVFFWGGNILPYNNIQYPPAPLLFIFFICLFSCPLTFGAPFLDEGKNPCQCTKLFQSSK